MILHDIVPQVRSDELMELVLEIEECSGGYAMPHDRGEELVSRSVAYLACDLGGGHVAIRQLVWICPSGFQGP